MIIKIKRYIRRLFAPKSPLKREIYYLEFAIGKTNRMIDYLYSLPQGPCCYYCAHPELHDFEDKLDKQTKRLRELESKISGEENND